LTKKPASEAFGYVKTLFIALILAFLIKSLIVEAYKIPSSSMEDTLLIGDFIMANKFIYGTRIPIVNWQLPAIRKPRQGDVIIFKYPVDGRTNYIKRCVAVAGQEVKLVDRILYVDNKPYPNPPFSKYTGPITAYSSDDRRINFGPYRVPSNHVFAMGDNRDNSSDSRFWGPVSLDLIEGEALFIHWSWSPDVDAPQIDLADLTSLPRAIIYNLIHFFQRVRWERLGTIVR